MHEHKLTQNIVETAIKSANNKKVKKIVLVIGESSGILDESIEMYFDEIAKDTVCEGAVIETEIVKSLVKCKTCGKFFERKPFSFECECGGESEPTNTGREFYIKYIEVEENE